jgi:hypothetical protein
MATKKPDLPEENQVIEMTISVQPRGKSIAVFTIDYAGVMQNGKIELTERQIRLTKRLLLDFTQGKTPSE